MRTFELVGFVGYPLTIKEDGKCVADFLYPLLDGWKCAKGDNEDAGIQLSELFLAPTQLCGMFTTGYSAKMTQENENYVIAVFQGFLKVDLSALNGL